MLLDALDASAKPNVNLIVDHQIVSRLHGGMLRKLKRVKRGTKSLDDHMGPGEKHIQIPHSSLRDTLNLGLNLLGKFFRRGKKGTQYHGVECSQPFAQWAKWSDA